MWSSFVLLFALLAELTVSLNIKGTEWQTLNFTVDGDMISSTAVIVTFDTDVYLAGDTAALLPVPQLFYI